MPEYQAPFVLAVDIGSSSVKAGLYDATARAVEGTDVSVPHDQVVASDGTSEEDGSQIQVAAEHAIDGVLAKTGRYATSIGGVGFDAMASTVLGVDKNDDPLTPVYTYADTRTAQDVEQLKAELNVPVMYDRTGVMQHTSYLPGRLRWLRRTNPVLFSRIDRYLDISTYLFTQWFGRRDVHASYCVSSWSGLLNRRDLCWDQGLLGRLGIGEENLPSLAPWHFAETGLSDEYARRWQQLADVPFYLSVGDGAAVNVGTGCVNDGRVALTVGTTGAMRVLSDNAAPEVPNGLWGYRLGAEHTLLGGSFSEGGNVIQWAMNTLRLPPVELLNAELSKLRPADHGIDVLPFIAGERATGWSNNASGMFRGIRQATTPLQILQAILESVSYRFSLVADLLLPGTSANYEVVASGGAIQNSNWWMQTMSDVLGVPVSVSAEEQDTSRGAAILALKALGIWESLDDVPAKIAQTFDPRPDFSEAYGEAKARQVDLYKRLLS